MQLRSVEPRCLAASEPRGVVLIGSDTQETTNGAAQSRFPYLARAHDAKALFKGGHRKTAAHTGFEDPRDVFAPRRVYSTEISS